MLNITMFYTPINGITWTVGALACSRFGYKSLRSYRLNKNPLSGIYGCLGVAFTIGLFFFGVPALLTNNTSTLKYTYFMADLFVQVAIQVEVWLLWFIALRSRIRLRYLLSASITFSSVLMIAKFKSSSVMISHNPNLVIYLDKPLVLVLKSIIYLIVALPLGYFFLHQVPSQPTFQTKAKSLFVGLIFIVVSLAATSNNVFDKGSDTYSSALFLLIFFSLFLIVGLLPRSKT